MSAFTDFSSLDNESYSNALNEYTSSLNTVNDNFANAKAKAQEKVDKFNQAIRDPLNLIGAPLVAKGVGATIKKVKANVNKAIGEKTEEAIEKAKDIASKAITRGREALSGALPGNPLEEAGPIQATKLLRGNLGETNIDELISQQVKPPPVPDEFDPSLIPEGARGRVDFSEPVENFNPVNTADEIQTAVKSTVDSNLEGATSTAQSAGEALISKVSKAGEDALKVGKDALEGTEVASASEGFLNPIADLANIGLGVGFSLAGLFAGKHVPTQIPKKPLQFTTQFGAE